MYVGIVLESSSGGYRHSRQFAYFPVYPGFYPQRPIEAIELPSESYLAPLFSYIALLMSSKARRQLPEALFHSLPPLPCPQPHPAAPALRAPALSSAVGAAAASRGGKSGDCGGWGHRGNWAPYAAEGRLGGVLWCTRSPRWSLKHLCDARRLGIGTENAVCH